MDSDYLLKSLHYASFLNVVVNNIPYARGGQTFRTKGRIGKNFEAEGRTAWRSKAKKVTNPADVLFSSRN